MKFRRTVLASSEFATPARSLQNVPLGKTSHEVLHHRKSIRLRHLKMALIRKTWRVI